MKNNRRSPREWIERTVLALVFVFMGGIAIVVFNPWGSQWIVDRVDNYLWRAGLSLLLLVVSLLVRRSERCHKFGQVMFGLFILFAAISLDWVFGRFLLDSLHVSDATPAAWAFLKVNDFFVIVGTVVVFTRLSGGSLGSIYLQRGKLKLGLVIGGTAFIVACAGAIPTAELLFGGQDLTLSRVLPWTPWVLLIVLANGALEEILFRGLFLRKVEPFFGRLLSNVLIALVFTVLHQGVYYTSEQLIFLAIV
ncbi:MAG: CPBP family intramembrane metalloprotease, partial [Chloroflexia bacterium]|nr:CPBP family intramembrane metalloprotease [Chloroflexia bacterium]